MRAETGREAWAEVDEYLAQTLLPEDETLELALDENQAAGLPPIDVSPLQGGLLSLLTRISGARRVLEIGTQGGYSTIHLARALPDGGQVVSLEYEPRHADVARKNVERAGLTDVVDIRVGAALDTLPTLAGEDAFDLVFIDADKPNNPNYLEWALRLTHPGSLIVGDNVVRGGRVVEDGSDPAIEGTRDFLTALGEDPRLEVTALQTVGAKGWDGFALALVR